MSRRAVDNSDLERWRALDALAVLRAVAEHLKEDESFSPIGAPGTSRLHVSAAGHDWELLVQGPKFWDARARLGGGGAVDLVMHLNQIGFKQAVAFLRKRRL